MGGNTSHNALEENNDASVPSTSKKSGKLATAIQFSSSKLKYSFKRKTSSRDQTKPFRELIRSWPIEHVESLLREFDADEYLMELQKSSDSARKATNTFMEDMIVSRDASGDLTLIFKTEKFKLHRDFFAHRCKKVIFPSPEDTEFHLPENFQQFSKDEMRNFLNFIYTETWSEAPETLEKLKKEFGCSKNLGDDMAEKLKNDLVKGDLMITVMENTENKNVKKKVENLQINCNATIASARSRVIRSLLSRKSDDGGELAIFFDEHIFPRSFATVFIAFLYTDCLDLSLVPSSDVTLSSLSQARAIVSGKSPDIQLHRALQIMQVARFFGVDRMVQACENVVVKHLTSDNAVAVLQWARDGGSKYIATHAMRLIESEFTKITSSNNIFDLTTEEMLEITESQFLQTSELELLESCIKWGEHDLLRKLEEREPNIVADTCHSISRRGLRRAELSGDELREILKPLTSNIRKDYALPPFHQTLTEAYSRGILERAPLSEDLIVCKSTSEINPDVHWLKPKAAGPRYFKPYHEVLRRQKLLMSGEEHKEQEEGAVVEVEYVNRYPEILEHGEFELARKEVERIVEKEGGRIATLPRSYHRIMAMEFITKRVLTSLDISGECFHAHLTSEIPHDAENRRRKNGEAESMGSFCSSIVPDLLPS